MTIVVATAGAGTVAVRSDFQLTEFHAESARPARHWPLPKLLILDPSLVVGFSGVDPQGAVGNLLTMWAETGDEQAFLKAIEIDDDSRRHYLVATLGGALHRWDGTSWRTSTCGQEWVGARSALEAHQSAGFRTYERQDKDGRDAIAEVARAMGFCETEIEAVLSGRVSADLAPELRFICALEGGGDLVGGIMAEAWVRGGKFQFWQQSMVRVLPGVHVTSEDDAIDALLGRTKASYRLYQDGDSYPARLRVDFTCTGASVIFTPTLDGYQREWSLGGEATGVSEG